MTNEIVAAAPLLMGTNTVDGMTVCVRWITPVSIAAISWMLALVLMPVASAVVFVRSLLLRRRGGEISWQRRFLFFTGLVVVTTALVAMSTTLHDVFYSSAMHAWDGGAAATLRMNIAHACTIFRSGILAGAFCFALALLLPNDKNTKGPPTTAFPDVDPRVNVRKG